MNIKQYLTKENILKYLLIFLRLLLISVCIGVFISFFQFCVYHLLNFLKDVFINHDKTKMIIFFCIIPITCFLSIFLNNINKNINSSAIQKIEYCVEEKNSQGLNWKKDLPSIFISSLFSFMSFACLGAEGPSLAIASNSALMVNDLFDVKDDETVLIAAGAGFGCALISPLAGIMYYFETILHKFTLKGIFKAIFITFIAFFISQLIFSHPIAYFQINDFLEITNLSKAYYTFPIIGIIVILNFSLSNIYLVILLKIKDFYKKYQNNLLVKYRGIIFYMITIPLAFFYGNYMSTGSMLISDCKNIVSIAWNLILLLMLFRLFSTIFASTSAISGGVVIPQLTIGALIGCLIVNLLKSAVPNIHIELYENEIILLSMISFYVCLMDAPLTGIALIFAFTRFEIALQLLLPATIVMFLCYFLIRFKKQKNLNELLKKYL